MKKSLFFLQLITSSTTFLFFFLIVSCFVSAQSVITNTEKQKALLFLQNNMKGRYSLTSDDVADYYKYMNKTFNRTETLTNDQYREAYRNALQL